MRQDSLRSVMYRSFLTCDDPKGVVEGKTIKRSKTDSSNLEGKIESQAQPKNLNRSSSFIREEREIKELEDSPTSVQLVEVKKGAQNLSRVIDTWPKGISFEGQSKDIAKDLLRGALDLQESLMMLGKLQEASQYMAKLKKKQKEKPAEIGVERVGSGRFDQIQDYRVGFQNPRVTVDGPSRDCYEELRNVIRDGLARQNLLSNSSIYEETAYFDRRKLQMSPDMPSTSSSRSSSMVYSHDFTSSDSLSSRGPEEKLRGSNLIARLMGLEETPLRDLQPDPQKQRERVKVMNHKRPIFDIDLPMARKPQFVVQKLDRERMSLEEIIEIMQSKGLLKSNKHQNYHFDISHTGKRFVDDSPPIVIMKPHRSSSSELCGHKALDNEEMQRNRKTKEEVPKVNGLNSKSMHMKQYEDTSVKKVQQERGSKDYREMQAKAEDNELRSKKKLSSDKMKASSIPVGPKPQKKEVTEKKMDNIQKVGPIRKKPLEKDNVKSKNVSKTQELRKVGISKEIKPEKVSNMTKNRIVQQRSASSISTTKRTSSTSSQKSSDRKKNLKSEKPVADTSITNDEKLSKDDKLKIGITCKSQSVMTMDGHIAKEESKTSAVLIEESNDESQTFLCEATILTTENESRTETNLEDSCFGNPDITERINNSKASTNHPESVSDTSAFEARVLKKVGSFEDSEIANSRLVLDCANELQGIESLRQIPTTHPLFLNNATTESRFCISEDRLVREINNGIESLRGYSELSKESFCADRVFGLSERDSRQGRGWSTGWRDGFMVDEVEQVVSDLEKIVLRKLIKDVVLDFVL